MSTKKRTTKTKRASALALRKSSPKPGKRASIATKAGFTSCVVLAPVDVGPKGGIAFQVALRVGPTAGKVSFVPRGKETLVIDAPDNPSGAALQRFIRRVWDKKGGDPPTVVDIHGRG